MTNDIFVRKDLFESYQDGLNERLQRIEDTLNQKVEHISTATDRIAASLEKMSNTIGDVPNQVEEHIKDKVENKILIQADKCKAQIEKLVKEITESQIDKMKVKMYASITTAAISIGLVLIQMYFK